MAVTTHTATIDLFRDWDMTPEGSFYNKVTKRTLTRQEWEIEMSYEHYDNDDALAFAKVLAAQAEATATK